MRSDSNSNSVPPKLVRGHRMAKHRVTKRTFVLLILFPLLSVSAAHATFSIVGYDPETKEWGVAVASRQVAVGAGVPWAQAGSGAVAVQARMDPKIGRDGLAMMKAGFTAEQTMAALMSRDDELQQRQFALIDVQGGVAAFTGDTLPSFAGDRQGEYFSVQGNILAGEDVLLEMERAYLEIKGPLALRLLMALQAGNQAGGDRRGRQSAALILARAESDYGGVTDRMIDLRVDNDPDAVNELIDVFAGWTSQVTVFTYLKSADAPDRKRGVTLMDWVLEREEAKEQPDAQFFNLMARIMSFQRIMPAKALEIALRADELSPDNPSIMDTVAEAYRAAGDVDSGIEWLRKALELVPESQYYKDRLSSFEAYRDTDS